MVLPPEQKTKSAKKRLGLNVQAVFSQSLRVQQVAPTSLCKGGKKVNFFLFGALQPLYRQSKTEKVNAFSVFLCLNVGLRFALQSCRRLAKIAENLAALIIFPAANANIVFARRFIGFCLKACGEGSVYPFAVHIGFKVFIRAPLNIISVANRIIPSRLDGVCPRYTCFKVFNGCRCGANSHAGIKSTKVNLLDCVMPLSSFAPFVTS